ncbi:GNAT family N-acetyltransferase [Aeromicrobium sp. Leaf350]|uniref:GNAT family N-acetyltransferase n=1 Tax=Aeromicrobium sp. Leaf350 TaxID=2876565 RepID=UPI001E5EB43A|nr:GNAT family N-acetyltransferase [Aeromicrobium sp. Leaf350]
MSAAVSPDIRPITADVAVGADAPANAEFRELVALRNAVEADTMGTSALNLSVEELLPALTDTALRRYLHVGAWVGGELVGRGLVILPSDEGSAVARTLVDVLPAHRGAGIGSALLAEVERMAAAEGRAVLQVDVAHRASEGGERLASPTGFGDVPAADPGARFLLAHGYRLEQVLRVSRLDLDVTMPEIPSVEDEFALHAWVGATPPPWLEDVAVLKTAMSTAVPSGELTVSETVWTAGDVQDRDARQRRRGRVLLTVVAEHRPSGRLVGITEIEVPADDRPAFQEDTLVLPEHRGHALGLRLKVRNLHELRRHAPGTSTVLTFNAEENRPMLTVNEAMGFRAMAHEGSWEKHAR